MDNWKYDEEDEYETPKVRRIDVEESRKQGKMVFVTKDQEEVIYQDEALSTPDEIESKYTVLFYVIFSQILFFIFISFTTVSIQYKGKFGLSLVFYIGLSFLYAIVLILLSKFCFKEYEYGTFINKSMIICGGQGLVLSLFMVFFIVYPMFVDIEYDLFEGFKIAVFYTIVYFIDIVIQMISVYFMHIKKKKVRLFSIIMLLTQSVAIWIYALIVVPFFIKNNKGRLVAYAIIFGVSIILGVINYFTSKHLRKNKRNTPLVIVYNSNSIFRKDKQKRKEELRAYHKEHKKELIITIVIASVSILIAIIATIYYFTVYRK